MSGGLLGTAVSGLLSFQHGLNTTGHNIANVNTEGYTRQRVEFETRLPLPTGGGYVGTGVDVGNIARVYDQFLTSQVRMSTSAFSQLDGYHTLAKRVDNFIADPATSLVSVVQHFFNAVQEVANDPTSISARQVLLSEANSLSDRFVSMQTTFENIREQVNQGLTGNVAEINDIASSIAEINEKIIGAFGNSAGKPPNDLLDKRDLLLKQLSEKVDVTVVPVGDFGANVFIGNGQALVLGTTAATLGVKMSALDTTRMDVTYTSTGSTPVAITQQISGGEIGGILKFRDEILDPAQRQLGFVAAGLALEFNALHQSGYDLDGGPTGTGNDFFAPLNIIVGGPPGMVSAAYNANVQDLRASDYGLTVDAAGTTFTLTRLSDNQVVGSNGTGTFSVDGMDISVTGTSGGESFLIRPAFGGAAQMGVQITDPAKIAAAAGDTASGAVGDNEIALKLADLQNKGTLLGGSVTFQQAFGQIVSAIGSKTRSADINRSAQQSLLNQAIESREAVSGVNLDEEAANLVKFQQSYQAASQLVVVSNTIFDSLLGTFRR